MNDLPALIPSGAPQPVSPAEYVCGFCERGQCARCRDVACTCCGGG